MYSALKGIFSAIATFHLIAIIAIALIGGGMVYQQAAHTVSIQKLTDAKYVTGDIDVMICMSKNNYGPTDFVKYYVSKEVTGECAPSTIYATAVNAIDKAAAVVSEKSVEAYSTVKEFFVGPATMTAREMYNYVSPSEKVLESAVELTGDATKAVKDTSKKLLNTITDFIES
jgi:hypothetical protein